MVKAQREITKQIKHLDLIIELLDARAPWSCLNSNFDKIIKGKPRVFLISKADLADPKFTANWRNHLEKKVGPTVIAKSLNSIPWNKLIETIYKIVPKPKGITNKVAVIGVPNVGKSTFINQQIGKKKVKVANRPAITRHLQWIRGNKMDLLDTPGLLSPRFSKAKTGFHLALIGSIRSEVIPLQETALFLISYLKCHYPQNLLIRFKINFDNSEIKILEAIGYKRGFFLPGGILDYNRTCETLINEFRTGRLGKITLETIQDLDD